MSELRPRTSKTVNPKDYLERTMKNWPAGSHLVMEGYASEGVKLSAIGYKYNKQKVICFIATDKIGHTEKGRPYQAKWIDDSGEKRTKNIHCPDICAKYFEYSNVINTHNHIRQFETALERQWVTQDGYFRTITTILGMTVTDTFKAYRHHLSELHRHKHISTRNFNDMLCHDMLNNAHPTTTDRDRPLIIPSEASKPDSSNRSIISDISCSVVQSPLSGAATLTPAQFASMHTLVVNPETHIEKKGGKEYRRTKRRYCSIRRCRQEDGNQRRPQAVTTANVCSHCRPRVFICGATCLNHHWQALFGSEAVDEPSHGWV